jgi:hypothetical protein
MIDNWYCWFGFWWKFIYQETIGCINDIILKIIKQFLIVLFLFLLWIRKEKEVIRKNKIFVIDTIAKEVILLSFQPKQTARLAWNSAKLAQKRSIRVEEYLDFF